MDAETREAFERLDQRFERVDQRFERVDQRFERVDQRFTELETRILERIEATETKLLSAFYGWAEATDKKLRVLPILDERLSVMEQRLTVVERKLLERGM